MAIGSASENVSPLLCFSTLSELEIRIWVLTKRKKFSVNSYDNDNYIIM